MTLKFDQELIHTYRQRAEEMRAIAERMNEAETRAFLEQAAEDYERMARTVNKLIGGPS